MVNEAADRFLTIAKNWEQYVQQRKNVVDFATKFGRH